MKFTKPNLKAFTLVELIIVIAIIAVLASLAFMSLSGETAQARDSKRVSDIKTFEDAVSTSNGKNKPINYYYDPIGVNHSGDSRTSSTDKTKVQDTLETNAGLLKPIRNAYLIPVTSSLFDSDVIPTIGTDPKGSPYFGAFLSTTDYSFYGTKENPETKIPTAIVQGSFKEGMIIDILTEKLGGQSANDILTVANPTRFVRGDIIKVDEEKMVVRGYYDVSPHSKVLVDRGYDSTAVVVHNKSASIKLIDAAIGGESLLCIGTSANAATMTVAPAAPENKIGETAVTVGSATPTQSIITGSTITAATAFSKGLVCNPGSTPITNPIVDGSLNLAYKIN